MVLKGKLSRIASVWIGISILLLGALATYTLATSGEQETEAQTEISTPAIDVRVRSFQPDSVQLHYETIGKVLASNKVDIYADVNGILLAGSKPFKNGVFYRKGEPLLRLENSERQLVVESARQDFLTVLIGLLPKIQNDYPESFDRWKAYVDAFAETGTGEAPPDGQSERERYFLATNKVQSLYLSVKSSEASLLKYRINAPFDGVLISGDLNPGGLIRAGQKLGEFIDISAFELECDLPVSLAIDISEGSAAVFSVSNTNDEFEAIVNRVGKSVDPVTQTVTAYATVDPSQKERVSDGMVVQARFQSRKIPNAFQIDHKFIFNDRQLFVVSEGKLAIAECEVVGTEGAFSIITGLEAGTLIVNQTLPKGQAGMRVEPILGK